MSQTTLSRKPRQRPKPQRTCRLTQTGGGPALVIRQQQGRQAVRVDAYFLAPLACELGGRGFRLSKHDGTRYDVRLDGTDSSCECPGHLQWGHQTVCKHVAALLKLEKLGRL